VTIRVQYVSGVVASGVTQHVLSAGTHFQAISALSRAFILPATTMPTVGIGVAGGGAGPRTWALNCDISSTTTILLNRAEASNPTEFAFWIIEYIGPAGGPNEFIMRAKRIFAFVPGLLQTNSNPISDIVDVNRCVPFISGRHDTTNTNGLRYFIASARMWLSGGDNVMQLTRSLFENGDPTYVCYCVEFTGSNWGVQTFNATNWTANVNQDLAMTPITLGKAWLYSHFRGGDRDTPAGQTNFAWIVDQDTVRTRTVEVSVNSQARYWVISNADARFVVSVVNAVDSIIDVASGLDTAQVTIPAAPSNGTIITGWLGSSATTTLDNPASQWRISRTGTTTAEAFRTRSIGSTEYIIQVVSFPADDASLVIQPAPAVMTLTGAVPNGPVYVTPGVGLLVVSQLGPLSEVTRNPAPAQLSLLGRSVIAIAIYPATATLSFTPTPPDLWTEKIIDIPVPALDYTQKLNAPPTVIIGTVLAPAPAALQVQALQHAATEGGDINIRSPATAIVSLSGTFSAIGAESTFPALLLASGLAPDLVASETLIEPGLGLLNAPGFEVRQVRIVIPYQWIDVEPAPVVPWT
jgi:hypothetical protein